MTYAVLYTETLEPITVLQLRPWMWDMLYGRGRIAVHLPQPVAYTHPPDAPLNVAPRVVEIFGEPIERRGHRTLMLFTRDEESALLLRSAFLPGQRSMLNEERAREFARGFLEALDRLRPMP